MNRAVYLRKYTNLPVGFSTQLWLFRDGRPALVMATPSRSLMECLLQAAAGLRRIRDARGTGGAAPRFGHPHPGIDGGRDRGRLRGRGHGRAGGAGPRALPGESPRREHGIGPLPCVCLPERPARGGGRSQSAGAGQRGAGRSRLTGSWGGGPRTGARTAEGPPEPPRLLDPRPDSGTRPSCRTMRSLDAAPEDAPPRPNRPCERPAPALQPHAPGRFPPLRLLRRPGQSPPEEVSFDALHRAQRRYAEKLAELIGTPTPSGARRRLRDGRHARTAPRPPGHDVTGLTPDRFQAEHIRRAYPGVPVLHPFRGLQIMA